MTIIVSSYRCSPCAEAIANVPERRAFLARCRHRSSEMQCITDFLSSASPATQAQKYHSKPQRRNGIQENPYLGYQRLASQSSPCLSWKRTPLPFEYFPTPHDLHISQTRCRTPGIHLPHKFQMHLVHAHTRRKPSASGLSTKELS